MKRRGLKWVWIPALLLALELAVQAWRHAPLPPSEAPVFSWDGATLVSEAPPPFGWALEVYRADRGGELTIDRDQRRQVQVFYFEWDDVESGPVMDPGGHEAEICNAAGGFEFVHTGDRRTHRFSDGESLDFVVTEFRNPDGSPVWVYKLAWLQGYGPWNTGTLKDRWLRLQRSFIRCRGAARVLQAGVFKASGEEAAWQIFEQEVLSQVTWSLPAH